MSKLFVPFRFTGLYYNEVFNDLLAWMRQNVPLITDEDPNEPFIQILAAYALVAHHNGVLLDHVALEAMFGTARLRSSVKEHLKLVGLELKEAIPATVDLVAKLATAITSDTTIDSRLKAQTETDPAIPFESTASIDLADQRAIAECYGVSAGNLTSYTDKVNVSGNTFAPWSAGPSAGDTLYFGHESFLFTRVDFALTVEGDTWSSTVLEYYNGHKTKLKPDNVENPSGTTLRLDVTSLLGSSDRSGATVRVQSATTGKYTEVTSQWNGAGSFANKNYVDVDYLALGLSSPDTQQSSYYVSSAWLEPQNVTWSGTTAKSVTFDLPETLTYQWERTPLSSALSGATSTEGYWMRLRLMGGTTSPTFDTIDVDQGDLYVKWTATQGETRTETLPNVGAGTPSQRINTSADSVIDGTVRVFVDEGTGELEWSEVDSFLSSSSTDKHFRVDYDSNGVAFVTFGDGTSGAMLPLNATVRLEYRVNAVADGNVGAGKVTQLLSGTGLFSTVTNPRAATGWQAPEGSTPSALEAIKISKPRELATLSKAITADDAETLAAKWTDAAGASPVLRAHAIEEGNGPKTIRLLVVGSNASAIPQGTLDELDTYFNGDASTGASGVIVVGVKVTSASYTPKAINVSATVKGGSSGVKPDASAITSALQAFLSPLAKEEDGTWVHDFGGTVDYERVAAEIFRADSAVKKVDSLTVNGGTSDIVLGAEELPTAGIITITVA